VDAGHLPTARPKVSAVKTACDLILDTLAERGPLSPRDIASATGRTVTATNKSISTLYAAGKIVKPDGRVGTSSPWALPGTTTAPVAAPRLADLRPNPDLDALFDPQPPPPPGKASAFAPERTAAEARSMSQQVLRLLASGPQRFRDMKRVLRTSDSTLGTALRRLADRNLIRKQTPDDQSSPWESTPQAAAVG